MHANGGFLELVLAWGALFFCLGQTQQLPCIYLPKLVTCKIDGSTVIDNNFINQLIVEKPKIRFLMLNVHNGQTMLDTSTFASLSSLVSLDIVWYNSLLISPMAFSGMQNLTFLSITPGLYKHASPTFLSGWLKPLTFLRSLNLSRNGITNFENEQFCVLYHLELLDLSFNHLHKYKDFGISSCTNKSGLHSCKPCLPHLTTLDISHNDVLVLNAYFARDLPKLRKLKADNAQVSKFPLEIKTIMEMEKFDISYNKLSLFEVKDMEKCNSSKLVLLKLKFNRLGYISPLFFECTKSLWYLELSHNNLTTDTLLEAGLPTLSSLLYLDLSWNNIETLQPALFKDMFRLQRFHCERCGIIMIKSDTFAHMKVLEELSLSENPLGYFNISSRSLRNLQLADTKLETIPRLWSSTFLTRLDLSRNNITNLGQRVLPTLKSLDTLILAFNNIKHIPIQTFKRLVSLTRLDIQNNLIQNINSGSFTALDGLTDLVLDNNLISSINIDVQQFRMLNYLSISNNSITSFNNLRFNRKHVEIIDLSNNKISSEVPPAYFMGTDIRTLNLTNNKISFVRQRSFMTNSKVERPEVLLEGNPLQCDCDIEWLINANSNRKYVRVRDIDLLKCASPSIHGNRSLIDLTTMDLLCPYTTECNDWECDCCRTHICNCRAGCYNQCSCFHKRDHSVNFMNCTFRNISSIPHNHPLYVKTIFLDGNNLTTLSSSLLNFKSVVRLFLNKSQVYEIEAGAFHNLRYIKEIYLQDNYINTIENLTFKDATTLERLYLQNNLIYSIDIWSFEHLYNIKVLHLENNELTYLNLSVFDKLDYLNDLSLHGNPWQCNCDFGQDFQRWLIAYEYVQRKANISCKSIINKNGIKMENLDIMKPLIQVDFSFCIEPNKRDLLIVVVSMAMTCLIIGILTIVCYKNRLLFLILIYNWFGVRFHDENEDDNEKPYDVYIAYAKDDEGFVINEILTGLEHGDSPYKVCLASREWLPGNFTTDSIIASVRQSKRTLLLVSENYFTHAWCEFNFQVAHTQVIEDKKIHLILILMDIQLKKRLAADMKLYTRTGTYLVYGEKHFWKKLRYFLADKPRGDGVFTPLNVYMNQ